MHNITNYTLFKALWLIQAIFSHVQIVRPVTLYICVFSINIKKQKQLYPYATLTDWLIDVFTSWYGQNLYIHNSS